MKSYSKVMKDNFLADLANMLMLRPVHRQPKQIEKEPTMANLSLTRTDALNRAAQAAYNAETSDDIDVCVAWAETAHAWVAVAKEMHGNSPSTVTVTLDDIPQVTDAEN